MKLLSLEHEHGEVERATSILIFNHLNFFFFVFFQFLGSKWNHLPALLFKQGWRKKEKLATFNDTWNHARPGFLINAYKAVVRFALVGVWGISQEKQGNQLPASHLIAKSNLSKIKVTYVGPVISFTRITN